MPTGPHSAVSMCTDCFSSDDLEAAARRTGLVTRASTLTGTWFLALVTFGAWSDATTTLAQVAAQVTHVDEQGEVSPEAIHPRLHPRALAVLQDLLHPVLATVQAVETVCDEGLLTSLTQGYLAASTGCALPDSRQELFPGSGGSAAQAGATIQAGWDDTSRGGGHCVRTAWNMPEQP